MSSCREVTIGFEHTVLQPYDPCPFCGQDMMNIIMFGLVCDCEEFATFEKQAKKQIAAAEFAKQFQNYFFV